MYKLLALDKKNWNNISKLNKVVKKKLESTTEWLDIVQAIIWKKFKSKGKDSINCRTEKSTILQQWQYNTDSWKEVPVNLLYKVVLGRDQYIH